MEKVSVYNNQGDKFGEVSEINTGCCDYPIFHAYTSDQKDVFQLFPTSNAVSFTSQ
jgi:hypothetical protein